MASLPMDVSSRDALRGRSWYRALRTRQQTAIKWEQDLSLYSFTHYPLICRSELTNEMKTRFKARISRYFHVFSGSGNLDGACDEWQIRKDVRDLLFEAVKSEANPMTLGVIHRTPNCSWVALLDNMGRSGKEKKYIKRSWSEDAHIIFVWWLCRGSQPFA